MESALAATDLLEDGERYMREALALAREASSMTAGSSGVARTDRFATLIQQPTLRSSHSGKRRMKWVTIGSAMPRCT